MTVSPQPGSNLTASSHGDPPAIAEVDEQVLKSENKDGSRTYSRSKRKVKIYNKLDALKVLAEYLVITDSLAPKGGCLHQDRD